LLFLHPSDQHVAQPKATGLSIPFPWSCSKFGQFDGNILILSLLKIQM